MDRIQAVPRSDPAPAGEPGAPAGVPQDPGADLTVEQVAALLEQVAVADIDSTVAVLDELLDRLRPARQVRRTLTEVPPEVLRQASLLIPRRRRLGTVTS